jgi:hypothetical protein
MAQDQQDSRELVDRFRSSTSTNIQHLAEILALVPVSPAMIGLVQQTILQDDMPSPWAEKALSSLFCQVNEFKPGVREELLRQIPLDVLQTMVEEILEAVVLQLPWEFQYALWETTQDYLGPSFGYFELFLLPSITWRNDWLRSQLLPFTEVLTLIAPRWSKAVAL